MNYSHPLLPGTLIKRYKRFLADITLDSGDTITVHCPNSGSMTGCSTPGSRVFLSTSDNPKRKYPNTLEMVQEGDTWIGVNTSITNKIVAEAIKEGIIKELLPFDHLKAEVKTSPKSRLDFMLMHGEDKTYLEVKNCSLAKDGIAMFPDAITVRGTKHLLELADLVEAGHRGYILFLVQRMDCEKFTPAVEIDKVYAKTLIEVEKKGVNILVYQTEVSSEKIEVKRRLPHFF